MIHDSKLQFFEEYVPVDFLILKTISGNYQHLCFSFSLQSFLSKFSPGFLRLLCFLVGVCQTFYRNEVFCKFNEDLVVSDGVVLYENRCIWT